MSIDFSHPLSGHGFLASASRDRLIHIFDLSDGEPKLIQTLDDHSAAVTSVLFSSNLCAGRLNLISCGADKAVYFRVASEGSADEPTYFQKYHQVQSKSTVYDITTDCSRKHLATVGQDRMLRIYDVASGEHVTSYKLTDRSDASSVLVQLDPAGLFAATSSFDKHLRIHNFYTGECLADVGM